MIKEQRRHSSSELALHLFFSLVYAHFIYSTEYIWGYFTDIWPQIVCVCVSQSNTIKAELIWNLIREHNHVTSTTAGLTHADVRTSVIVVPREDVCVNLSSRVWFILCRRNKPCSLSQSHPVLMCLWLSSSQTWLHLSKFTEAQLCFPLRPPVVFIRGLMMIPWMWSCVFARPADVNQTFPPPLARFCLQSSWGKYLLARC